MLSRGFQLACNPDAGLREARLSIDLAQLDRVWVMDWLQPAERIKDALRTVEIGAPSA